MTIHQTIEELVNQKFDPISQKIDNLQTISNKSIEKINKNELKEILNVAKNARFICCSNGPKGKCRKSCKYISNKTSNSLKKLNIEHEIVSGEFINYRRSDDPKDNYHEWIEFPQYNYVILDITADQFGDFPEIWFPADKRHYIKHKSLVTYD